MRFHAGRWSGVAAVVASLAVARAGAAQSPPSDGGVFRLFQGAAEIGRETFSDDGTTQRSTVLIPLINLKLVTVETRAGGRAQRIEMRAYNLRTDSLLRTYTASARGDSVDVELAPSAGEPRRWTRAGTPDEFAAEQSVASLAWLVQQSHGADHEYRVWLPSADSTLPYGIAFHGDSAELRLGPQALVATLGSDGKVRTVALRVGNVRFERWAGGDSLPPLRGEVRPTPDYGAPPGAPYTADAVRVPVRPAAGDTFSLGCTLTRPIAGGPRFPAAITLTGSGLQDRDENLWPLVPEYRLFRQVADALGREGIAVLRCDDRSFGASGGRADSATMLDFAGDARAQIAWLRARSDIDGARIAVIGHSEGGIVGPMVAAADPRVAAVVVMAGTAKPMAAVIRDQFLYPVESATGLTPEERDSARARALRDADAFMSRPIPWLEQARDYDPLVTARRVRQPVLIVQGAVDRQVSAGQADTLAAAMRAAGNRQVTVRVFPGLNHLFLVSPSGTGSTSEYAQLTDVAVSRNVIDTIGVWLHRVLGVGR